MQIIRNELIRDNEVSKEWNDRAGRNKNDFVQIDWNFIPDSSGNPNIFALNNGFGCLVNNGLVKLIKYYCNSLQNLILKRSLQQSKRIV